MFRVPRDHNAPSVGAQSHSQPGTLISQPGFSVGSGQNGRRGKDTESEEMKKKMVGGEMIWEVEIWRLDCGREKGASRGQKARVKFQTLVKCVMGGGGFEVNSAGCFG